MRAIKCRHFIRELISVQYSLTKMFKVAVLVAVVACAFSIAEAARGESRLFGGGSSSDCRYWCKTPEGRSYCCENENQKPDNVGGDKRGECPPVRPTCPKTRGGRPNPCSNDGACPGREKCCFDRCLEQHVCKSPV